MAERGGEVAITIAERDVPHVAGAASMLMSDRTLIAVRIEGDRVFVSGDAREENLHDWWRTALLNERLVAEAAHGRTSVIAGLVS